MAANTSPIYSLAGVISWATLAAANTARDGTGAVATLFIADATNGGRVERIRARAIGTNVNTVLRLFINNGSSSATPANNTLWAEVTCPATTLTEVAALAHVEVPNAAPVPDPTGFPLVLPPGYKLLATIGTAVAAGLQVTAIGGKY